MKTIITTRHINAPLNIVFQTVADIRNFSKAAPHIVDIEFLTERKSGVGTRFRETRLMNGKKAQTVLEVTEFVENDRVRLVADAGGTIWDTVFSVQQADNHVELRMQMEVRPYKLLAKLFIPLIRKMVVGGVEQDMDCVKNYCEKGYVG